MGYNKRQFVKKNDKKILHKVRKHWVIISMALLGLVSATGITKSNVHASNLDTNHQTNDDLMNSNSKIQHPATIVQTNGNNGEKASSKISPQGHRSLNLTGSPQTKSIHQFTQNQMTKRTDALRDRILINEAQSTPKQIHKLSSTSNQATQKAAPQINSASSSFNNITSAAPSASQTSIKMTKVSEPKVGDAATTNASSAVSSAISDISNKFGQVGTLTTQAFNYINQAKSASNVAKAQLSRYSDIDPQSINANSEDSNYGSTSSYAFSDDSNSAKTYANKLNIDLEDMPSAGAIQDSIKANFANSMANSLSDQILDDSDDMKYQAKFTSLANEIDEAYDQAQEFINSMSSMANDASTQVSNVNQTFSSVSASADAAGKALYNDGNIATGGTIGNTFTTYPVVNVTNSVELANAMGDADVKQVNIVNNIDLWNTDITGDADWWIDTYARNMKVNGLNNDGSWNTIDLAGYNFNFNTDTPDNYTELMMENLHMYGINYYGTFDVNSQGSNNPNITIYKNISYVGSQLGYNEGYTSGIFEGKVSILNGASYSPTGKYQKYDYYVPDHLSPHPFAGDGHVNEDPNAPLKQTSGSVILQGPYRGASIADYDGYPGDATNYVNSGGPAFDVGSSAADGDWLTATYAAAQNYVPDIAIPVSSPTYLDYNVGEVVHNGINAIGNQQIIQISGGQSSVFKSNCDFDGATNDGDCFAINGSGNIILNSGAKVHLTPRGNYGENTGSGDSYLLPSGVDVNGTGNINVNPGATLEITPKTDTDQFYTGDKPSPNLFNYAPAALNMQGGTLDIGNGATFAVKYPQSYDYSLPDTTLYSTYADNPQGGVSVNGKASIEAHPYSKMLVNGGGPSNKAHSGQKGNLVFFGAGGGNAASRVKADQHSDVELSSGGSQPVTLFYAPSGTYISVNDPKQFSLDLTHNTYNIGNMKSNPNEYATDCSQLATSGVSIEGDQVTGYDEPNQEAGTNYDKFDHSFGQYNRLVLPGQQYQLPSSLLDTIEETIDQIEPIIKNTNAGSTSGDTIWGTLGPVVWGTSNGKACTGAMGYNPDTGKYYRVTNNDPTDVTAGTSIIPTLMQDPSMGFGHLSTPNGYTTAGDDILGLTSQAHLIPFGISNLNNTDNQKGTYEFNNSIDLPYIITYSMINYLETKAGMHLGIDPNEEGIRVANQLNTKIDSSNYYNSDAQHDDHMFYNNEAIPIHHHGFNITKGFAFRGVPQAYVEGVKVRDSEGNLVTSGGAKKGDVISGYAEPESYIKIREGNDYNEATGEPTNTSALPGVTNKDIINDYNYDYNDDPNPDNPSETPNQHLHGYLTTAKEMGSAPGIGYWSYKLPADLSQDQLNDLIITAHTATVGNKNSARNATYYMNGVNRTLGKFGSNSVPAGQEIPQPAHTHNVAPTGAHYAAYLSNSVADGGDGGKTLTVTGNFDNYGHDGQPDNGIDGKSNATLSNVNTLNLGNAWNIYNANWMFNNMYDLYTINQIGDWNTNDMQTAIGTFDKDDRMNAQYVGPIVSTWGNSSLTNNNMGNGNDDPQYNGLISTVDKSNGQVTDPINFINNGNIVGSSSITGYSGTTYNIDADKFGKLSNKYTLNNAVAVTLSGHPHDINVVNVGSPIYIGDTVSGAEAYYQNSDYFPSSTYPLSGNETPTGNNNDPTYTDDDDAGSLDSNDNVHLFTDGSRNSYQNDDTNAGQYFQAGRLKGDLDRDNLTTDNSIYVMPEPFIIGYLTAQSTMMSPKQLIGNINKIIKHVTHIKGRIDGTYGHPKYGKDASFYDYKPKIWSDQSSADTSMADLNATMDSLGILLEATSPNPSHPYYPYENLSSLASSLADPDSSAANDDSLVRDQYSDVSQIDDRLGDILNTLDGYRNNLVTNAGQYNQYQSAAENAGKNHADAVKQLNLLEMNTVASADNDIISNANVQDSSANQDESSASDENQSASSDSNSMSTDYDTVRGSASNYEGDDFNSVAQSYTSSATMDSSDIVRYSTDISHRDRQMSVANNLYSQNEAQLDYIANSLENYVPILNSLNNMDLTTNPTLSNEYRNDYSAASNALNFLESLDNSAEVYKASDENNSGTGNQDSSDATSASIAESQANSDLSYSANMAGTNHTAESNFVNQAMLSSARSNFNQAQLFNSLISENDLDSADDSKASSDNSLVASAWSQIRSLNDKISAGGDVSEIMATMAPEVGAYERDIKAAKTMNKPNSSTPQPSNNSANKNYQGAYTVTMQDEDSQGRMTSRDVETIPVDAPIGSVITIDPQDYRPIGFSPVASDHSVSVKVTGNGVEPGNVTFHYVIGGNDQGPSGTPSNSNSASANNSANSSRSASGSSFANNRPNQPTKPILPSSSNNTSLSSSNSSNSSSSSTNHQSFSWPLESSSSAISNTHVQNNSRITQKGQRFNVNPAFPSSGAVSFWDSPENSSDDSSQTSSSASVSSANNSAVNHSQASRTSESSSSVPSIRQRVNRNSSDTESTSHDSAAQSGNDESAETNETGNHEAHANSSADSSVGQSEHNQYVSGVNDARLGNPAQSNDPNYQTGYHSYQQAKQKLPQTGEQPNVSLIEALLLAASGLIAGYLADRRRRND